jgi:hypothetical protein
LANKSEVETVYNVSRKTVGGKDYIVRSVYLGDKDIKAVILKMAERKAIKEMGLSEVISKNV